MLKRKLYGHVFVRRILCYKLKAWKNFKMLKLSLTFVFLALKDYFFNISIYDLLLLN